MTTYTEFKDYIMTHLWKVGDSVVVANLDLIVKTAETELNRVFKVEDRVAVTTIEAEAIAWPLPDDFRTLRSLTSVLYGEMKYNIPSDFANKTAAGSLDPRDFTVVNKTLRLVGEMSADDPLELECWYYRNIPYYGELDDSEENWLAEEYFDVLLYCVLKHTAPFLREDERLQTWGALYSDALQSALDENEDRKFAGSPLKIKFPQGVA